MSQFHEGTSNFYLAEGAPLQKLMPKPHEATLD